MSDLHGNLDIKIEPCDVVCIAGDISPLKYQRNLPSMVPWLAKRFATWAQELPCEKVFLVSGNHDFVFESQIFRLDAIAAATSLGKVVYLENSEYIHEGKKFYGSPWVIGPANWAFYDNTGMLGMIDKSMPDDIDVAIFHQPLSMGGNGTVLQVPDRYIGETFVMDENYVKWLHPDFGSMSLDNIVMGKKPKYVITGHVHSGNHEWCETENGTKYANVSLLDENYKLKYKPTVFDI